MMYIVFDAYGRICYQGSSWPMARAALDKLVLDDIPCPALDVFPEPGEVSFQ